MRLDLSLTDGQVERVARFQDALPHEADCDFPPYRCSCRTLYEILPALKLPQEAPVSPNRYLPPPAAANPIPADPTEATRRALIDAGQPALDLFRATRDGSPTWTTDEATAEFEFLGFSAPFVAVRRRSDGVRGTLEFTHAPRRYFDFVPEDQ